MKLIVPPWGWPNVVCLLVGLTDATISKSYVAIIATGLIDDPVISGREASSMSNHFFFDCPVSSQYHHKRTVRYQPWPSSGQTKPDVSNEVESRLSASER